MSDLSNMNFSDLEPGMRIFHLDEQDFGTIIKKDDSDKDWLMIEVKWENEDPKIDDRSYVLGGANIAVVITADNPIMANIRKHMGDKIDEVEAEHGSDFEILNIVNVW